MPSPRPIPSCRSLLAGDSARPIRALPSRAFTLIEVVVAVGIFAIAMVAVVALFAPVARSVADSADVEAAARVADALRTKLQTLPLPSVGALCKKTTGAAHELTALDASGDYDIRRDQQLIFANRDGSKIGTYDDPVWGATAAARRASDREKFFEIALLRNEALSPKPTPASDDGSTPAVNPDIDAVMLAYVARLRWPAFVTDATGASTPFGSNPTGTIHFDHGRKQVAFFSGSVRR